MSDFKCVLTLSSMDDAAGYQLQTHQVNSLDELYYFLLQRGQRSKIQKLSIIDSKNTQNTVSIVIESLVVKSN